MDIRYLRENAKKLAELHIDNMMLSIYVSKDYELNSMLGKEFSVFQEIYLYDEHILADYLNQDKFPSLQKLLQTSTIQGWVHQNNSK